MTKKIKAIYVEYDDARLFNITDLHKPEYEEFLDLMHRLNIAYETILRDQKLKDNLKD